VSDRDDIVWLVVAALGIKLLHDYNAAIVPALQQKGADVYDTLHPQERGHANDLPGKQLTRAQLEQLAKNAGFPDPHFATAITITESGGVPNALGDIRDDKPISIGLWQINTRAHPKYGRDHLLIPYNNALAAYEISKGGANWGPWSTYWRDPVKRTGPGQGRVAKFL